MDDYEAGQGNVVSHPSYGSPEWMRGRSEAAQWVARQAAYDAQVDASHQSPGWTSSPPSSTFGARTGGASSGVATYGGGGILGALFVLGFVVVLLGSVLVAFNARWENIFPTRAQAAADSIKPLSPESLPSVEQVLAKTRVADPIETLARQAVALGEITWAIHYRSKAGEFGRLTREEAATAAPYARLGWQIGEEAKELIRRRGAPKTGWNTPQGQWSNLLNANKGIAWELWPQLK